MRAAFRVSVFPVLEFGGPCVALQDCSMDMHAQTSTRIKKRLGKARSCLALARLCRRHPSDPKIGLEMLTRVPRAEPVPYRR